MDSRRPIYAGRRWGKGLPGRVSFCCGAAILQQVQDERIPLQQSGLPAGFRPVARLSALLPIQEGRIPWQRRGTPGRAYFLIKTLGSSTHRLNRAVKTAPAAMISIVPFAPQS